MRFAVLREDTGGEAGGATNIWEITKKVNVDDVQEEGILNGAAAPKASLPTRKPSSLNQHSSVHLPVRFVLYVRRHGRTEMVLLQTSRHFGTQPVVFVCAQKIEKYQTSVMSTLVRKY